MIRLAAIALILHSIVAYLLWQLQSRALRDGVIAIGLRDRLVALFWSPLCGWLLLHGLIAWAWDVVRREARS